MLLNRQILRWPAAAPSIKRVRAILRIRGESKQEDTNFWRELLNDDDLTILDHPDFAKAFADRVREVWEEIREEVLAKVDDLPEPRPSDAPEQEVKSPVRSPRRCPSDRRRNQRRGIRRRM